ncbi:MAG: hypothetical protein ACYC63_11540 [Armatimonadota bacterium]
MLTTPPPPPRRRAFLVTVWERLTAAPVKRPPEVTLVAGLLAGLLGFQSVMAVLVWPLYLASYPWQSVSERTGIPIDVLYHRETRLAIPIYAAVLVAVVASVAALQMRRWGRIGVEAILWLLIAYIIGVMVWMNPFKHGVYLLPFLHWPPNFGYFVGWWITLFKTIPAAVVITPCALGIRILHRPHVAEAFAAAAAARRASKADATSK